MVSDFAQGPAPSVELLEKTACEKSIVSVRPGPPFDSGRVEGKECGKELFHVLTY